MKINAAHTGCQQEDNLKRYRNQSEKRKKSVAKALATTGTEMSRFVIMLARFSYLPLFFRVSFPLLLILPPN